jgi:pimeloyl-ACP methyl ester carboxylesterase
MAGHVRPRKVLSVVAALAFGVALAPPLGAAAEPEACSEHRVPVALAPGQPTEHFIWGRLCSPKTARDPRTIQLLVHGYSLSHAYWDFPYQPERYSYTRFMAEAGYATFNVDRLGIGNSSKPLGGEVNLDTHVFTLHQVIAALRGGAMGGVAFDRVVAVGHSYGTATSETLAGVHPGDVDLLVATGWLHPISPSWLMMFRLQQVPAQIEERLRDRPPAYVTPAPGTSPASFYSAEQTDPAIGPISETLRQTGTEGEWYTGLRLPGFPLDPLITKRVRIPILFVMGQNDILFCGGDVPPCDDARAVVKRERPYFSSEVFEAYIQPAAGHNVTEQLNAHDGYRAVLKFLDRELGVRRAFGS